MVKATMNNTWYKKKRDRNILIAPEYHLILCEGEQTEPNYFEEIKRRVSERYPNKITIKIETKRSGRLYLLNQAQKMVKESSNKIKHVWLVYDKDDFDKDDFDNTVKKIKSINETSDTMYHALWSNQCIEVWFLFHFIDLKVDLPRKDYIKKLNENFKTNSIDGKYKKNDKDIYNKLEKYQPLAIRRAKSIILENDGIPPSQIAPASTIYEIFDILNVYLNNIK